MIDREQWLDTEVRARAYRASEIEDDRSGVMDCPQCGEECWRDEADVGVGVMYGPYGCPGCGWSQDPRYDITAGPKTERGHRVDQWGGLTPQWGDYPLSETYPGSGIYE